MLERQPSYTNCKSSPPHAHAHTHIQQLTISHYGGSYTSGKISVLSHKQRGAWKLHIIQLNKNKVTCGA